MFILEMHQIKKWYGERLILDIPSLEVNRGGQIGIIGLNGSGKSTLLNIMKRDVMPDEGQVKQKDSLISYIRQIDVSVKPMCNIIARELDVIKSVDSPCYSGGEKTKLKIAQALEKQADLLLADEPTANLDFESKQKVYNLIMRAPTFVIVSHDRELLNLCSYIWEIKNAKIHVFKGNYENYVYQSKLLKDQEVEKYEIYSQGKKRLTKVVQQKKQLAEKVRIKPINKTKVHRDSGSARSKSTQQKNMQSSAIATISRINQLEKIEKPKDDKTIKIDFNLTDPPKNRIIIECKNLHYGFQERTLFFNAGFIIENSKKYALYGKNGTGKTTLLNLIYERHPSIYMVPKARLGYFRQNYENIDYQKTVLENVSLTSVQNQQTQRTVLARLGFSNLDIHKKAVVLSGGERVKLSLAKLITSDANVLLLDEPTNYLDIFSVVVLQNCLKEFQGTVVFITHDHVLINAVTDYKLIIQENKIITEPIG